MEVIYLDSIDSTKQCSKNINLVLGLFDGLHVGHEQLIRTAKYLSIGKLAVVTFDKTLKSNDSSILMTLEEKIAGLENLEVDEVYIIKCDENFKKMSYEVFINEILKKFDPIKIYCGQDFRFGYKAQGDVEILKSYFPNVTILNYVNSYDGSKISSSFIKNFIREGKIEEANNSLGREYSVTGKVIKGKGNGHKLGFPTLNLDLIANYVLPKEGVYITKTIIDGHTYFSMTNVGTHPTIDEIKKPIIESYVLDFYNDIYSKNVKVLFVKKLRDEKKFSSLEELKLTLKENEEEVRKYYKINF